MKNAFESAASSEWFGRVKTIEKLYHKLFWAWILVWRACFWQSLTTFDNRLGRICNWLQMLGRFLRSSWHFFVRVNKFWSETKWRLESSLIWDWISMSWLVKRLLCFQYWYLLVLNSHRDSFCFRSYCFHSGDTVFRRSHHFVSVRIKTFHISLSIVWSFFRFIDQQTFMLTHGETVHVTSIIIAHSPIY